MPDISQFPGAEELQAGVPIKEGYSSVFIEGKAYQYPTTPSPSAPTPPVAPVVTPPSMPVTEAPPVDTSAIQTPQQYAADAAILQREVEAANQGMPSAPDSQAAQEAQQAAARIQAGYAQEQAIAASQGMIALGGGQYLKQEQYDQMIAEAGQRTQDKMLVNQINQQGGIIGAINQGNIDQVRQAIDKGLYQTKDIQSGQVRPLTRLDLVDYQLISPYVTSSGDANVVDVVAAKNAGITLSTLQNAGFPVEQQIYDSISALPQQTAPSSQGIALGDLTKATPPPVLPMVSGASGGFTGAMPGISVLPAPYPYLPDVMPIGSTKENIEGNDQQPYFQTQARQFRNMASSYDPNRAGEQVIAQTKALISNPIGWVVNGMQVAEQPYKSGAWKAVEFGSITGAPQIVEAAFDRSLADWSKSSQLNISQRAALGVTGGVQLAGMVAGGAALYRNINPREALAPTVRVGELGSDVVRTDLGTLQATHVAIPTNNGWSVVPLGDLSISDFPKVPRISGGTMSIVRPAIVVGEEGVETPLGNAPFSIIAVKETPSLPIPKPYTGGYWVEPAQRAVTPAATKAVTMTESELKAAMQAPKISTPIAPSGELTGPIKGPSASLVSSKIRDGIRLTPEESQLLESSPSFATSVNSLLRMQGLGTPETTFTGGGRPPIVVQVNTPAGLLSTPIPGNVVDTLVQAARGTAALGAVAGVVAAVGLPATMALADRLEQQQIITPQEHETLVNEVANQVTTSGVTSQSEETQPQTVSQQQEVMQQQQQQVAQQQQQQEQQQEQQRQQQQEQQLQQEVVQQQVQQEQVAQEVQQPVITGEQATGGARGVGGFPIVPPIVPLPRPGGGTTFGGGDFGGFAVSTNLQGVVTDVTTTRPIPKATVQLVSSAGAKRQTKTDAKGRYKFVEINPDYYQMTVMKEAYEPSSFRFLVNLGENRFDVRQKRSVAPFTLIQQARTVPSKRTTIVTQAQPVRSRAIPMRQGVIAMKDGDFWMVAYPPFKPNNIVHMKTPPSDALVVKNIGQAYKTITSMGGNGNVLISQYAGSRGMSTGNTYRKPTKRRSGRKASRRAVMIRK